MVEQIYKLPVGKRQKKLHYNFRLSLLITKRYMVQDTFPLRLNFFFGCSSLSFYKRLSNFTLVILHI